MNCLSNSNSFGGNMPLTSVDRRVRRHTRKVQHLIKVLPSEFTFRELLQAAGYLNVNKLDRPMRATITRNIPSSYRTDKKRDGARVYFKQRDGDFDWWSCMISNVVDWIEELIEFGWIDEFSW